MAERIQKDSVDLQTNAIRVVYTRTTSDKYSPEYDVSACLYWWVFTEGIQVEMTFDKPDSTQKVFDLLKGCRSVKFSTIQADQTTIKEEGHE